METENAGFNGMGARQQTLPFRLDQRAQEATGSDLKTKKGLVTPLLVKWISQAIANCEDDIIRIQEQDIELVRSHSGLIYQGRNSREKFTVVGRYISYRDENKSRMVLTIDDSTGTLDVIIYKKSDTDTPEMLDNIELK